MKNNWVLISSKAVLGLIVTIFLSRGVFLTLVMGGYYSQLAAENRTKKEVLEPVRGEIVDVNGKKIVENLKIGGKLIRYYEQGEVIASLFGLEKQYQIDLAGISGERLIEETAQGEYLREINRIEAIDGSELKTNINLDWQKGVYWALKRGMEKTGAKSGSVIVNSGDGKIMALVSLPAFDPNLFVDGGKRSDVGGLYADIQSLLDDNVKTPMLNRAIGGVFAPGSVFKPVVATAGLMEGVIDGNSLIEDTGEISVGGRRFGNWLFDKSGGTEGKINVVKALARSNDIFFYRLGEKLGVDRLSKWVSVFGFGQKTGIDLPGEVAGLMPTPLWKEKTKDEPWYLGDTFNESIGQGDVLATPLQIAMATTKVVSGFKCIPRVVSSEDCEDLGVDQRVRQTVIEGMEAACSQGGTAFPFFSLAGKVWCKTGTAQQGGEKDKPHAWITVVVPGGADDWKDWVVVTVMLEQAGEGSSDAGPVAREIVDMVMSLE